MRTTVRLPADLLERAKRKAVADGTTLTALIEAGLRLIIAGPASSVTREKPRELPRVFEGGGWLLPGVDPVKALRVSDEDDDLEYMERLEHQKHDAS